MNTKINTPLLALNQSLKALFLLTSVLLCEISYGVVENESNQVKANQAQCAQPNYSQQARKWEMPLPADSEQEVLVGIRNNTGEDLTIAFTYMRDQIGSGQKSDDVPVEEDFAVVKKNTVTFFSLPKYQYCEKVATGGLKRSQTKAANVRLVDILKSSKIVGFSLTLKDVKQNDVRLEKDNNYRTSVGVGFKPGENYYFLHIRKGKRGLTTYEMKI